MADSTSTPEGFSLKRWSRRKLDATRAEAPEPAPVAVPPAAAAPAPIEATTPETPDATTPDAINAEPSLPPVESLTPDSDYSAFMQPKVDEALKRAALKKLFTDPHFNVMDGLDIYIGDYTQPDPMPEGMLEKLGKVYGMAKEAVADGDAEADAASIVDAHVGDGEAAPAPAGATDEPAEATAAAEPGISQPPPAPDPQATLPLDDFQPAAIVPSPAVTEPVR